MEQPRAEVCGAVSPDKNSLKQAAYVVIESSSTKALTATVKVIVTMPMVVTGTVRGVVTVNETATMPAMMTVTEAATILRVVTMADQPVERTGAVTRFTASSSCAAPLRRDISCAAGGAAMAAVVNACHAAQHSDVPCWPALNMPGMHSTSCPDVRSFRLHMLPPGQVAHAALVRQHPC